MLDYDVSTFCPRYVTACTEEAMRERFPAKVAWRRGAQRASVTELAQRCARCPAATSRRLNSAATLLFLLSVCHPALSGPHHLQLVTNAMSDAPKTNEQAPPPRVHMPVMHGMVIGAGTKSEPLCTTMHLPHFMI